MRGHSGRVSWPLLLTALTLTNRLRTEPAQYETSSESTTLKLIPFFLTMKKTRHTQSTLNSNCTSTSAHHTPTPPPTASPIDAIQVLERIEQWPANSNSDPDAMAEALDQIQQLAAEAVRSLKSQQAHLSDQLIIHGEDGFGPFLMIGDFRAAMPSKEVAHLIAQLLNKQSYCGQVDCPCGPVVPPHASAFNSNAT